MRTLIVALWFAFLLISIGIGMALYSLYQQGEQARVARGQTLLRAACESIGSRYSEGSNSAQGETAGVSGRDARFDAAITRALKTFDGIEGGLWSRERGFLAYAYPTYGGSTPKTDIPVAEEPAIEALAKEAAGTLMPRNSVRVDQRETVLLEACPMPAPPADVVAWSLLRIHSVGPGYSRLLVALGLLLGFVLLSGAGLGIALGRRSTRLASLERALAEYQTDSQNVIAATGDGDLDRIVHAFNALGMRLGQAQREAARLQVQVAQSDRLAALGRLSAGLAHEIRNPLAAMRLKAENAIAATTAAPAAPHDAIKFVLAQIERLELLLNHLLSMTQTIQIKPALTDVPAWIAEHVQALQPQAQARNVSLRQQCAPLQAMFDTFHLGRALDNLIANALQHAPSGTSVRIEASAKGKTLTIRVADAGGGVPAHIRENLFEPFVSGRADGTGLGLAIVREILTAHGGTVRETHPPQGACFEMELPWRAS